MTILGPSKFRNFSDYCRDGHRPRICNKLRDLELNTVWGGNLAFPLNFPQMLAALGGLLVTMPTVRLLAPQSYAAHKLLALLTVSGSFEIMRFPGASAPSLKACSNLLMVVRVGSPDHSMALILLANCVARFMSTLVPLSFFFPAGGEAAAVHTLSAHESGFVFSRVASAS